MKLQHLDVVMVFLYPLLMEEKNMVLPPGIASYPCKMVCLLSSIYGEDSHHAAPSLPANDSHENVLSVTKQAAHNWWKELSAALKEFGLVPAVDEETIFVTADNWPIAANLNPQF
eukprot:1334012-Rhodomonas_salina.1